MFGLPFREVWALDTEFVAESGARPVPVCVVARELRSGRLVRLWQDEFADRPPFPVDNDTLFVAYFASAEWGCFLELGWALPTRVLDLYAEFRVETNGITLPEGRGLLCALSYHGITSITSEEKHEERALVMRGGPWSAGERRRVLDYCQSDVDVLGPLLERMAPAVLARRHGLGQALLRGRYTVAVARMEATGVPVDTDTLDRLRGKWGDIKLDLVRAVDRNYGVLRRDDVQSRPVRRVAGGRGDRLASHRDGAPTARPGHLPRHCEAVPAARATTGAAARDGRAAAGGTSGRTGRPQPHPDRPVWGAVGAQHTEQHEGHLRPRGVAEGPDTARAGPGDRLHRLVVARGVDCSATVGGPGAARRRDLRRPVPTVRRMAGLAPPGATRATHKAVRDVCKTVVLGTNYGMQAKSLAYRIGLSPHRGPGPSTPPGQDVSGVHRVGRAHGQRRPGWRRAVDGVRLDRCTRARRHGRRVCATSPCRPTVRKCCDSHAAWPPSAASRCAPPCTTHC